MLEAVVDRCRAIEDRVGGGVINNVLPHRVATDRAGCRRVLIFDAVRTYGWRPEYRVQFAVHPSCAADKPPVAWGPRGLLRRVHEPMVRLI